MNLNCESGYDAWLRYAEIDDPAGGLPYRAFPAVVAGLGCSEVVRSAQEELCRGIQGMLGRRLRTANALPEEDALLLGTFADVAAALPSFSAPSGLAQDGYCLRRVAVGGRSVLVIGGTTERGVLYGTFALLRRVALREPLDTLDEVSSPSAPIRMVNQWDNLDGSIERGYAGDSIFWENDHLVADTTRLRDFARLLASLGINGCSINNVNADTRVITPEYLPEMARAADIFRPWGIRLIIAIDFSSPQSVGGLDTFDPIDPRVAAFWQTTVGRLCSAIPDLGGFVLKADSEGRLGPAAYGRTHADAANVIARALKPCGGVLFYRGFVYDHHMDWRDIRNDRARASYDNFHPLDGTFDDNVIVQIKHGPIDFQVREPASPLFGALEKTNQVIEVQVTQEYIGQQRHHCFLIPMWKEVLDFDLQVRGPGTPVKELAAGKTFDRPLGGFITVLNVGKDTNWLGHHFAMANLYGFGRLTWDPNLSSRAIADEWTHLTFGHDPYVVETTSTMLTDSWKNYEDYTGSLGVGTLTDIIHLHYGPGIESSERNGWGQWHRADETGIGMDRTMATGTGFIGQYAPAVARTYECLSCCPDELLLFFHHARYDHVLRSGKTIIQHVYDTHYEGAAAALANVHRWRALKGRVDGRRYHEILTRLEYQAGHARVWRDAICQWFFQMSGIADEQGRVGHAANRIEAEDMTLKGYAVVNVTPWETASGGKAAECIHHKREGSVSFRYDGEPGWFDLIVQYFDENDGISRFTLFVAGQEMDTWLADDIFPSYRPDGHTSTARNIRGIALRPGDEIRIDAKADGGENAVIDYVEIHPAGTL